MKRILAFCLSVVMVMSMSVAVFAAPGGFVSSPSGNPAPTVVSFDPADDACTAQLVITPYGDRHELAEALRALFEKAYNSIASSSNLAELNAELAKIAQSKNIDGKKLAVSDLFDIHVTGCDFHDGHYDFDVVLKADTLKKFVGLLHMNKDGVWELVADARVTNNGEHLEFSVESLSPFAIVVDTSAPYAGDSTMIYVYAIVMAVSATALVVLLIKGKKHRA